MSSDVLLLIAGGAGGLIAAIGTAIVNMRMIRPRQEQVIAQTRSTQRSDDQKLLERYEAWVDTQAEELGRCHTRIDQLEKAEEECNERARSAEETARRLGVRVAHLEDVILRAGLNGDDVGP